MASDSRQSSTERSEHLLRLLADQAKEHAIMLLDPQGRISWWSRGAEHLLGFSAEEVTGRSIDEIFTPEDLERGIPDLELEIAGRDAKSEDDRWHQRADGSRFWSTGAVTALRDERGVLIGFGKIMRNRTNLKEQIELYENRIEGAQTKARDLELVITTFSHELRNLLTGLTHGIQLLREQSPEGEHRAQLTTLMQEQLQLVQRLTEDLVDAERLKSGKMALTLAPVALQEVLQRVLEVLRPKLSLKQLQADLLTADAPIVVNADAARLYQVFANLVENAIKYTPAKGRIWIKATIEDPEAVVHIEDSGVGIPPEMLNRVFDLFTQVHTVEPNGGLGIGLSLVRNLTMLHGGSVQARSEGEGKGSEFTVRLPLHRSAQ